VRVRRLEWEGKELARPREVQLFVTSACGLADLPRAGTSWAGSGEMVFDREFPLAPGYLRVKSLLLMRRVGSATAVDTLRESGVEALRRSAGADPRRLRAAALAAALALQRLEAIQEGEIASMRRSGLVHLLSVSGLHVGLVGVLAWGVLNLAGVPPATRRWLVAIAVVSFALLAGGNPPVRRAATAGVAFLVGRQFGRPLEALPVVWGIVAGLAVLEPSVLLQAGFQLSVFVTLALVRWIEPLARSLRVLPTRLAQAIAVAVVAQGASMPLVGAHFGVVPPLGVVASLLAAPLELVLVGSSLLALGAAWISNGLGGPVLEAVAVGQGVLDRISAVGGASSWPFPPLPAVIALTVGVLGMAALTRCRAALPAAVTLAVASVAWILAPGLPARDRYEARMLGVGEGMALLLRCGAGAVLVDAGRSPVEAWRELARNRVRRLDALVVTHPDADHTGGAAFLLDRLGVGRFAFPEALGDRPEIVSLRRLARLRGVAETPLALGQRAEIGGARWEVLWPPHRMEGVDNDASLVARVLMGGSRLMIAGDIEARGEGALLTTGADLRAEMLQLPHHGSRTSSTPGFLAAVRPLIALAATGTRPRFPYPSPSVARATRSLPAVLVVQSDGEAWVGWGSAGRFAVGAPTPVLVARSRGPAHE
jgi:competence protein ComEC